MERIDLSTIPTSPGVYLYKDSGGRIIYVGKAKHLRRRVASYFRPPETLTPKTRAMIGQARSIDTLTTETEKEALLLEASLIKKHRPRYNIVLRDDKQYVLFKLDLAHDYPRLTLTRRVVRDGGRYFGPYTSALAAKHTWKAVHRVFPLRRCKNTMFNNRVRPCLYHQMGQCLAPCVLDVDRAEYRAMIYKVEMLLSGRATELIERLTEEMLAASEAMRFEEAAELRDQIRAVEQTVESQAAVLPGGGDLDVIGFSETSGGLGLGVLFVRQGRLIDKKSFFWSGLGLEDAPQELLGFLSQFYGPGRFVPARVLIPWAFEDVALGHGVDGSGEGESGDDDRPEALSAAMAERLSELRGGTVRIAPPRNPMERKLVGMAAANAREDAVKRMERPETPVLDRVGRLMKLPGAPERIEAVDVSHTSGQDTRVGVVVYENGSPRKDAWREYAFPEPETPGDDYGVLAEWVGRRIESGPPWPDLLLIDGGRGQLSAVERAMREAGCEGLWPLASIAKAREGERTIRRKGDVEDHIFLPGRVNPLPLKAGSPELLFLQQVRDAVHRYVIGRHRRARRKSVLSSELMRLPGLGPKTARLLWDHFGSPEAMAAASLEDIMNVPGLGRKKAAALHEALKGLGG